MPTAVPARVKRALLIAALAACAEAPEEVTDPNAGLLRDFLDGKYDDAGHPLNARVLEARLHAVHRRGRARVNSRCPTAR